MPFLHHTLAGIAVLIRILQHRGVALVCWGVFLNKLTIQNELHQKAACILHPYHPSVKGLLRCFNKIWDLWNNTSFLTLFLVLKAQRATHTQ